jgi:tripartite-type tricarboxylate transporter receptor subunit TctC
MMKRSLAGCFALVAVVAIAATEASAQEIFRGKTVTIYVGSGEGGPYDAHARLVGRHIGKHLPGHPTVVVQNMPGASGRRLNGFMSKVAPKDGTAIAIINRGTAFDPLVGNESSLDIHTTTWLGNTNNETNICMVWHGSPIRTLEDLRAREMVVGTSGPASMYAVYPNVLSNIHGLKFRVVGGYKSATETHIAMQRGEVDGRCGISWDTLIAINPEWVRDTQIRALVQIGVDRIPELGNVPSVFDLAATDEERHIWELWSAPLKMARPFLAPPGMAPDRAELMRRAFDATMQDPDLRSEAAKMRLAVASTTGEEVAALLKRVYAMPKAVIEKAAAAAAPPSRRK